MNFGKRLHPNILHSEIVLFKFQYMSIQRAITFISAAAVAVTLLCSCTFPTRTGYDRSIGGYKPVAQANNGAASTESGTAAAPATPQAAPFASEAAQSRTSAGNVKAAATQKSKPEPPKSRRGLEQYANAWLGAKYEYGAASKKKTDCSGFVMQVYKGYYNIALDHNASKMYKDPRGSKVSRGSLKEGDLIFFGSFWSIDHVGIYLNGDRFIHASSSKGVIISPMNDKYWSPKYQGGRRFK